jgi:hypothetical protein
MDRIRPFIAADIAKVVRLHEAMFKPEETAGDEPSPSEGYFTQVFLENPSRDASLPSLVYEDDDGRIVGFLGVVPRRMSLNGEALKAAICSQLVVDAASRRANVAVQLAGTFLDGPQDVSICDEADDAARTLWEQLGGTTALLQSIYWTRPLRPARLALSFLRQRHALAPLAAVAGPPLLLVDALAARMPHSLFFQPHPGDAAEDLRASETVLPRMAEFAPDLLRVEYDDRMFEWLLQRASERRGDGVIHKTVVRSGETIRGWYLYHLDGRGAANVLQIAVKPSSVREVLDCLFHDAWQHGATAVTGRLEPRLLEALSDKLCFFNRRGSWMLVNAKRRELLRAFQDGEAFFSRFDGEWSLGFWPDRKRTCWSPP